MHGGHFLPQAPGAATPARRVRDAPASKILDHPVAAADLAGLESAQDLPQAGRAGKLLGQSRAREAFRFELGELERYGYCRRRARDLGEFQLGSGREAGESIDSR